MTKYIVNNRTDSLKTDVNLFFTIANCQIVRSRSLMRATHRIHVSVHILTMKISQWAPENFCCYRKNFAFTCYSARTRKRKHFDPLCLWLRQGRFHGEIRIIVLALVLAQLLKTRLNSLSVIEFIFVIALEPQCARVENTIRPYAITAFDSKGRYEKLTNAAHVQREISKNLVISRCCFKDDGWEMYQDSKRTGTTTVRRTTVLLIKPFVWWHSR